VTSVPGTRSTGFSSKDEHGKLPPWEGHYPSTRRILIFSRATKLVATVGVDDLIIISTEDSLLICKRGASQDVKRDRRSYPPKADERLSSSATVSEKSTRTIPVKEFVRQHTKVLLVLLRVHCSVALITAVIVRDAHLLPRFTRERSGGSNTHSASGDSKSRKTMEGIASYYGR